MKISDFEYNLPQELIAQTPLELRDQSRLMVLDRKNGTIGHHNFYDLVHFLHKGDVLVFNESRVIPARLFGRKAATGGKVEILLLKQLDDKLWEALVKPGKRVGSGTIIEINSEMGETISAEVVGVGQEGIRSLKFSDDTLLPRVGKIPLPPYIHTPLATPERYQTVYSRVDGSVAAPTAGLHFTKELLTCLSNNGVICVPVVLHIGLDTFRPVVEDDPRKHAIHSEYGVISKETAAEISRAKAEGRRIVCVGTTAVRILENAASVTGNANIEPFEGWVKLFILPGHKFAVVDTMITNFHLPKSTLLMLVSAFAGKELMEQAYQQAIQSRYRFYSFGDAMLIL